MWAYERLWADAKPELPRIDIKESYKRLESLVLSDDPDADEKFVALAKGILLLCENGEVVKRDWVQAVPEMLSGKYPSLVKPQTDSVYNVRASIKGFVHGALALSLGIHCETSTIEQMTKDLMAQRSAGK